MAMAVGRSRRSIATLENDGGDDGLPIRLMPRQPLSQRRENTMDGGEALMAKVEQAANDQGVREMKEVRGAFGERAS